MNRQLWIWRLAVVLALSFFSPSLFAQNCANNQSPIANVGPDRSGNIGVSMTFSSQGSSDPEGMLTSYWFNFGDGQFTGWQPNPSVSHIFAAAGTYSVRLWVRDQCNAFSAADIALVTISAGGNPCAGNTPPLVQISVPSSGVVGQSLSFSATNSSDPGGSIASYSWNFGDGSSANGVSVSKSYSSAGNFTITLTLTDNCGATATVNASISISAANPCANNTAPVANAGPDKQGNPNVAIAFSGSASSDVNGNSTIQSYWFNFGDGSFTGWQSSASASHAFVNVGSYTVRLWVRDNCGAMSASDLAIVTIAAPNPCAGNTPPNAVITSPASGLVNQVLNFSGLSSSDTTGTIQSYAWDFGDGQTASGVNVSHSYTSAGNKTVTLTLTDSCGAQGSMTRTIVISNPDPCAGNQAPVAQASANPPSANINQSISFSAAGSIDPNGSITSYAWNFGDGSSGSGLSASHAYASAGSFNVVLTVTDNCGATATKTISVSITNPNSGIAVSKLTHVDVQTGQETWVSIQDGELIEFGLRVKFEAPQLTAGANLITWSFLDGSGSSQPAPIHAYSIPGTYTVQLTVYDQNWIPHTINKTIHVAQGMHHVSTLPLPPITFNPRHTTLVGDKLWAIRTEGDVGVVDVSDPENLQPIVMMNAPLAASALGMAISPADANGLSRMYVVAGMGFVRIYRADPQNFALLKTLGPAELGAAGARGVGYSGSRYLYVGTRLPHQIVAFDVSNPSSPVIVNTLPIPGGVAGVSQLGQDALLIDNDQHTVTIVDIRQPVTLTITEVVNFGPPNEWGPQTQAVFENSAAIRLATGPTVILDVGPTNGNRLRAQIRGTLPVGNGVAAFNRNRIYLVGSYDYISKFDITALALGQSYLMEEISPMTANVSTMTLFTTVGHEGQSNFLINGIIWNGFNVFATGEQ